MTKFFKFIRVDEQNKKERERERNIYVEGHWSLRPPKSGVPCRYSTFFLKRVQGTIALEGYILHY